MLTIKHDENLIRAAQAREISAEELIGVIFFFADLDDDDIDPYAGETLGKLMRDHPDRWSAFPGDPKPPYYSYIFDPLRLQLVGADAPCPECGWETTERDEDHMIVCPHCGWSQPMFLSEQNDE